MYLLRLTEESGREIYINPGHVISVFAGDGATNVKVSDGKVYKVTQTVRDVVVGVNTCSSQD